MRIALALALLATGCAASPGRAIVHDDPTLGLHEGKRVALRTDLDPPLAALAAKRLEKMEEVLDRVFPWLDAPTKPVSVQLLADEARWSRFAHDHDAEPASPCFACSNGEVAIRYRPEEWGQGPVGGWLLAPRSAAIAEVIFRRRLEATLGPSFDRTLLEEGCARLFAEQAARSLGEEVEAERRARDDLLAAFLPVFLGGEDELVRVASARGNQAVVRAPARAARGASPFALPYAVARFLAESQAGVATFRAAFDVAANRPRSEEGWAHAREQLAADEAAFARWLRARTVLSLLDAATTEPIIAARWEARAALRVILGADPFEGAQREAQVARARELASSSGGPVRFLDELEPQLAQILASRRPGELERFVKEARATLEARTVGYGHPALEEGKGRLLKAIEERCRRPS